MTKIVYAKDGKEVVLSCNCKLTSQDLDYEERFTGNYFYDTSYSNEEDRRRKIYQKMVDIPAFNNNQTKTVNHDIENVDKIWIVSGFTIQSSGANAGQSLPLPFAAATQANTIYTQVNRTQVSATSGTARANNDFNRIIVQYTCTDR